MNLDPDNAAQVEEIERHLAQCEAQAAYYRNVLGNLHPAPNASVGIGESLPQGDASGQAATAIPRSRSNMGSSAVDPSVTQPRGSSKWSAPTRQRRSFSQQERPAQPMSRSASTRSDLSISLQQHSIAASFTSLSSDHRPLPRGSPATRHLPSVQEHGGGPDVGITPDVYLAQNWVDEQSYLASTRTNLSANDVYNNPAPSACPSMISGSSVVELSQPLTRQNSSFDGHPGAGMMRYVSSQSRRTDRLSGQDGTISSAATETPGAGEKRSACDQDFFGVGAGFAQVMPQSYPPSAPTPGASLFPPSANSTFMERSASNASATSVKSTGSNLERRFKEACQRVRQNSNRNIIAPKPQEAAADKARSTAPSKRDGKVALQKTPYQRPKHPKVYCNQCDEYPEGFRGDHELRRHLNTKHRSIVKKFVCRDPATVGLQSKVKVLYPLSECRACESKKQYGAYYNAAAHLRRTHFKPKAPRGKNKGSSDEKRGGKGGGDWPPMADLKLWYEEVHVASDASTPLDDGVEDEAFEQGEDTVMTVFSDFDNVSPSFDHDYGLSLAGSMDGHLHDAAGTMPLATDMAAGSASMGYLPYESMAYMEVSTPEYAFSGEGESPYVAASSADTVMPTSLYGQNSQVISDYMWTMEDV
ncbi:hypothetical protein TOPH_03854 [Tolypocladium ophioglossoides CBS 100239]|uniref:DUF7896 domain-containing protein n=1 Tax=Tolypocladium ophioglossoides (strain CBS 100239) TaxID=1163406 RepID=A0A0L0NC88_TOLOC|nr:hypothetical protein TOPH_03854 [Tolypocladium ophioglossoides CBS 100239]